MYAGGSGLSCIRRKNRVAFIMEAMQEGEPIFLQMSHGSVRLTNQQFFIYLNMFTRTVIPMKYISQKRWNGMVR